MNGTEQKKALEHIRLMLAARVNSGSAISADTVKAYLIAVSDYPLEAIEAACLAFIKGNVIGYDFDYYPPSGPRLGIEVGKWAEAQRLFSDAKTPKDLASYPPPPEGTTRLPSGLLAVPVGVPFDWERSALPDGSTVDYGRGTIALGGLTRAEVETVDRCKGVTKDGRSMVGMSTEQIRDAIAQRKIAGSRKVTPMLQRMIDK